MPEKYHDYNRTHAREKLIELENLNISKATFNRICNRNNILKKNIKRRKKISRSRRERMKQTGLLLQMDGSPHKWFGVRKTCLVIMIEDATNNFGAVKREGFSSLKTCLEKFSIQVVFATAYFSFSFSFLSKFV